MMFDIRTLLLVTSAMLIINTLVLSYAWSSAKHTRVILGYWSLSQACLSIGILLLSFQKNIPDFLTMFVSNCCTILSYWGTYEGYACYIGYRGNLRKIIIGTLGYVIFSMWYFTFIYSSSANRILHYSVGATIFSVVFITIFLRSHMKKEQPVRFLIGMYVFQIAVMLFRIIAARTEGEYYDFINSSVSQEVAAFTMFLCFFAQALCYFWLIAYRLSLEIQKQSITDALTGLYNRRALEAHLNEFFLTKEEKPFAFFIVDVDKFKIINDVHGHQAGDLYLKQLSNLLLNRSDTAINAYRYAGDEFSIVFFYKDIVDVANTAEAIRKDIENLLVLWNGDSIHTTISIGIAITNEDITTVHELIKKADAALYKIKALGGNNFLL